MTIGIIEQTFGYIPIEYWVPWIFFGVIVLLLSQAIEIYVVYRIAGHIGLIKPKSKRKPKPKSKPKPKRKSIFRRERKKDVDKDQDGTEEKLLIFT